VTTNKPSGNAQADTIQILGGFWAIPGQAPQWPSMTVDIDDLYIVDNDSSGVVGPLGDVFVQPLFAAGAGADTQWAVTGAASNWQAVSQTVPDDDASYVASTTIGQTDLYTFQPPTGTGTVVGIQFNHWSRKDDAGNRVIAGVVMTGGNTGDGPQVSMGSSYQDATSILEKNPANGNNPFTSAEIATDQFGVTVIS